MQTLSGNNAVNVILFDISKAFNTVPHSCLLNKLTNSFSTTGNLLSWIKAFVKKALILGLKLSLRKL